MARSLRRSHNTERNRVRTIVREVYIPKTQIRTVYVNRRPVDYVATNRGPVVVARTPRQVIQKTRIVRAHAARNLMYQQRKPNRWSRRYQEFLFAKAGGAGRNNWKKHLCGR